MLRATHSKQRVTTWSGIHLICWQKIKACKLYQFRIRRWLFEDTSCLQCAASLKMCLWCVFLWCSDEREEIFLPSLDVGTRAQGGRADSLEDQGYLLLERENQPESANTKGQPHTHRHSHKLIHTCKHTWTSNSFILGTCTLSHGCTTHFHAHTHAQRQEVK